MVIEGKFVPRRPSGMAHEQLDNKFPENRRGADEIINRCVHAFIMFGQGDNVIQKRLINQYVFANTNFNYRTIAAIIEFASKRLHEVFGLRLFELDQKFLLVSDSLEWREMIETEQTEQDEESYGLIHLVLCNIFASVDQRLTYDEIKKDLQELDINHSKDRPQTRNNKVDITRSLDEFFDEFVKNSYLTKFKDGDKEYFGWGPRAKAEVDPEQFFKAFLETTETQADEWPDLQGRIKVLKDIPDR